MISTVDSAKHLSSHKDTAKKGRKGEIFSFYDENS